MRLQYIVFVALIFLLISPSFASMTTTFDSTDTILVNRTDVMSDSKEVPMQMWLLSIMVSIVLVIVSFSRFPVGEEILISIMAIAPAWYAYLTAHNVDQIVVTGITTVSGGYQIIEKHTIYHFDDLALFILLPLAVFTIINSFRIWLNYRQIKRAAMFEERQDAPDATGEL